MSPSRLRLVNAGINPGHNSSLFAGTAVADIVIESRERDSKISRSKTPMMLRERIELERNRLLPTSKFTMSKCSSMQQLTSKLINFVRGRKVTTES